MAMSAGGSSNLNSTINVTPMVDIMLVLLIIFMITAPVIYQSAIKVQLPKTRSGESSEKSPFQFTIGRDGALHMGAESIPDWSELPKKIQTTGAGRDLAQETASISADEAAQHGQVVKLMDVLREAGLTRFSLNVQSAEQAK